MAYRKKSRGGWGSKKTYSKPKRSYKAKRSSSRSSGSRQQTLRIVLQQAPQTGAGGLAVPGMMPASSVKAPPARRF